LTGSPAKQTRVFCEYKETQKHGKLIFIGDFIMKEYVYAVVYSSEMKQCLVFMKKAYGFFFKLTPVPPEHNHGGGAPCFPGGGLEVIDKGDHIVGARREFLEETGVDLNGDIVKWEPLASGEFIGKTKDGLVKYCAVFFDVDTGAFNYIVKQCETNLNAKKELLTHELSEESIGVYKSKPPFIQDDELESLVSVSLANLVEVFPNKPPTDWFYNFVYCIHCRLGIA
jgi:8-oxo-dGTP pyrophosphatase MutT (NUDIX family)